MTTSVQSVAVIGAGAAGLAAAWLLSRADYHVHLFEAAPTLGGHAHTVDIPIPGTSAPSTLPVDVGFIVYNTTTYPDLISLFQMLGVDEQNTSMSFSSSIQLNPQQPPFEWGSDNLAALFADRANLYKPSMYTMLYDMTRFNKSVYDFVQKLDNQPNFADANITLAEFLDNGAYSTVFIRCYLVPMIAAVWSASFHSALAFPARTLFHFFVNHGLAQVFARPQWRTPSARSRDYVNKVAAQLRDNGAVISTSTPVTRVVRSPDFVTVFAKDCEPARFDHVIFATHAPTTLKLLADCATDDEKLILGAFQYSQNKAYLHDDANLMPINKAVWSSWNFINKRFQARQTSLGTDDDPVCVSYWLNRLQNYHKHHIPVPDLFLTLNPVTPIPSDRIIAEFTFDHPQFTEDAVSAQPKLQSVIQGKNRSWFCGAYARYGFHEDAMMTGFDVAERLSGYTNIRPWRAKQTLAINDNSRLYDFPRNSFRAPLLLYLGALFVINVVISRLQAGLGDLAARMRDDDPVVILSRGDGRLYKFGRKHSRNRTRGHSTALSRSGELANLVEASRPLARVTMKSPKLLARAAEALREGHELAPIAAAAFAAAEYDCPTPLDLTVTLRALFIADGLDSDPSKARKGRAKFAENLLSLIVGGVKKTKSLTTHTRLPELTTCLSNVIYPSWWLELDRADDMVGEKSESLEYHSLVASSDRNGSTKILELLGDLSETTVSTLQKNKEAYATIVVSAPERGTFVRKKAELLSVMDQVAIQLFDSFVNGKNGIHQGASSTEEQNIRCYDLVVSPALINICKGTGFRSLENALAFLKSLVMQGGRIEVGATVYGARPLNQSRKGRQGTDPMFSGDEGFWLWQTREIVSSAEKSGFELQGVSFMNNEEAALDVYEVIERVYNSLAVEKLEPEETRLVLAQMCLWEAALRVKYIRRMAASFKLV